METKIMEILRYILNKIFMFEKEPQKIGLTQLKNQTSDDKHKEESVKQKDINLSDLMRRVS